MSAARCTILLAIVLLLGACASLRAQRAQGNAFAPLWWSFKPPATPAATTLLRVRRVDADIPDPDVWVLTVRLFAGDPIEIHGPFTERGCERCAHELWESRGALALRFPDRKLGPGYLCFEANADVSPALKRSPCGE